MTSGIEALLVDSNLVDAQLFEQLIDSSNLAKPKLHHSRQFSEAIAALETTSVDVILIDLGIPGDQRGVHGTELVKQLRERAPQIPIVAMNSVCDRTIAAAAFQAGAQEYLIKPDMFSPERLQKLGRVDIGNLLVTTIQSAIQRAELTQQLTISKERYEIAVEGSNDGIWDWDLLGQRIYYSDKWQSMIGLASGSLQPHPKEWFSRIHPNDVKRFKSELREHLTQQKPQFKCEYRLRHSDGTYRWFLTRGMSLRDNTGNAYRIAGSQTDITARKSLENSLHQEKTLAQITLHSIGDAVITTDRQGYIENFNPVAEQMTGWRADDAKHQSITEVCQLIDGITRIPLANPALQAIEEGRPITLSQQTTLLSQSGREFAISDSAAPIRSNDGDIIGTVLVFHDVSEERSRVSALAWQASHDPLTKLRNRTSFVTALSEVIEKQQQPKPHHVVCYLDLDNFKVVNDTCGHVAGDLLLQQVADLWSSRIRTSDVLARLGGDEFGLLLYNCDVHRATVIAQGFCNSIQSFRFTYNGRVFKIGVSIGVVPIDPHDKETESIQAILGLADNACYQAKQLGRNRIQLYRQEHPLPTAASEGNRLRSRLTEALETDSFCLYQQPITSTNPRLQQHTFCEVLLRLDKKTTDSNQSNNTKSKSTQLMPPTAFLPSAERYHLMPRIDRWVIEAVLWHIANHSCQAQSIFSINLSAASLEDNSFLTFLQQQLSRYPVRPERLCFEISEKTAIANLQQTIRFTTALKQMGCQIALDDFGSGLSALTYLQKIPVDYLKLDGDFIREIANDPLIYTMLKATNQVSQFMGIKTIAKSVENIAILHKIRSIGIDYIQGYHNSKPQPLLCLEPQAEAMYASTAADHALAAQTPCSPALPKIT
ncbi:MAG: EAL domain-containing protein [Cyanobacteria bacterium P01_F01_bin.3]